MTHRLRTCVFAVAAAVFAADRLSKYFVIKSLVLGQSVKVIPDVFHITLVANNGAAFGIMRNFTVFFIVFSIVAIAVIFLIVFKVSRLGMLSALALALILGGASGNLVDRLKFGHVVDFLDFRIWPVFNIADSAISVGVVLIALSLVPKRT